MAIAYLAMRFASAHHISKRRKSIEKLKEVQMGSRPKLRITSYRKSQFKKESPRSTRGVNQSLNALEKEFEEELAALLKQ